MTVQSKQEHRKGPAVKKVMKRSCIISGLEILDMGLIGLSPSKGREKFRTYLRFNSKETILPPGGTIYTDIKVYSDSLTEICCAGGRQLYQQDFCLRKGLHQYTLYL